MMRTKNKYCIILLITLSFPTVYGQELNENLKLLEPFLNKKWKANEPRFGEDAVMEWTFEIIEDGKAVKRSDTLKVINATSVYVYYWDFDKQEIGVFGIHSNGNYANGHVKKEDGKILVYGYAIFPDKRLEFRNTFEFAEDGIFYDKYYRFEDGAWQAGHSRVFY